MIETIQKLCAFLSEEQATVQNTAAHLGQVLSDQGENLSVIIQPDDSNFSKAEIVREFETGKPAHVELTLADNASLPVAEVTAVFGSYQQIPKMQPKMPTKLMFTYDEAGKPFTCAVITNLAAGPIDQAAITSVVVRRDIRLD